MRLFRILACSLLMNMAPADPKPVTLTTLRAVTSEPGSFRFTIRIEQDAANRDWCIELDGDHFYRGSCLPIVDGTKEAVLRQVWIENVPGGSYEARAWVCRVPVRNTLDCPKIGLQRLRVRVLGRNEGLDEPQDTEIPGQAGL